MKKSQITGALALALNICRLLPSLCPWAKHKNSEAVRGQQEGRMFGWRLTDLRRGGRKRKWEEIKKGTSEGQWGNGVGVGHQTHILNSVQIKAPCVLRGKAFPLFCLFLTLDPELFLSCVPKPSCKVQGVKQRPSKATLRFHLSCSV